MVIITNYVSMTHELKSILWSFSLGNIPWFLIHNNFKGSVVYNDGHRSADQLFTKIVFKWVRPDPGFP